MPPQAPTQQQNTRRRGRPRSRYGEQLSEKQNLKQIFGVREEQLKRYYQKARHYRGETGPTLIMLLEKRLDNAVYRAGWASSRSQSRQMVSHRFFEVNGRPVNIPSLLLKTGDTVTIKENKRAKSYFTNFAKSMQNAQLPSWIALDVEKFSFNVVGEPTLEEAALGVDVQAVVELFAR